ncbi:hypothetical protein IGI04_032874 [Brassica rapa subsp. trilocularis]|uniref:ADF-H domain-containing protein n=1 Tax=Brassica rapa subsp. trilocularis TaxID=1813537 RepID=A0ABQ7L763_BRACM|nr:hypothetical protein IGI04_032874 [Brassica rapa subsp. trilocularis]
MGFYRPLVQLKLNRFVNQLVLGRIGKPEETNHVRREERGSKLEGKRNKTLVHHVDLNAPMFFRPKLSAHHKANSASGMHVNDECKVKFMELKAKRTYRYIVFKIDEKAQEVQIEKLGNPQETYDDFTNSIPENECRYAIYDFDFTTEDNCQKSKIYFIAWSPDTSRVRSKMLYASSKDRFKREMDGIQVELQATDPSEMSLDIIKERALSSQRIRCMYDCDYLCLRIVRDAMLPQYTNPICYFVFITVMKIIQHAKTRVIYLVIRKTTKQKMPTNDALVKQCSGLIGKAQLSVIKAWKEEKITKVTSKTQKKLHEISGWENKKTRKIESQLASLQRKMDSKKMEEAEKLRSKKAAVHAKAQEKKAKVQTRRAQEILHAEEEAARLQATGQIPNKSSCGCF